MGWDIKVGGAGIELIVDCEKIHSVFATAQIIVAPMIYGAFFTQ